jgi:hypothetical protein
MTQVYATLQTVVLKGAVTLIIGQYQKVELEATYTIDLWTNNPSDYGAEFAPSPTIAIGATPEAVINGAYMSLLDDLRAQATIARAEFTEVASGRAGLGAAIAHITNHLKPPPVPPFTTAVQVDDNGVTLDTAEVDRRLNGTGGTPS